MNSRFKKISFKIFCLIIILILAVEFGNPIMILFENNHPSESKGTTSNGSLVNGKRLPNFGENFIAYSKIGTMLGRNAVNDKVHELMIYTFNKIYSDYPDKLYVYGETSWVSGGNFYPHKTHQNGLSVDIMTPVLNEELVSEFLPTNLFNKFGYSIDFKNNKYEEYSIDYESISIHLFYLNKFASKFGLKISRVIFDPQLQPNLWKTKMGSELKNLINFSNKRSWVIHDDHYHIDFEVL